MPVFSVIVPIFNAEKTLKRCLESIRIQSFADFEVLLIENGSSDSSADICNEYVSADSRFHLYFCEKKGPSAARNLGLENKNGSFIAFIDSDDYVTNNYLEQLHLKFEEEKADTVFFGYNLVASDGSISSVHIPTIPQNISYYQMLLTLSEQDMFGYTWIKAFRASAISDKRFSEKLNLMEDEVFACEVFEKKQSIAVLPNPIYYYVIGNNNSLMSKTHQDYCLKLDATYLAWKKFMSKEPDSDKLLLSKAYANVMKCMYYGFERDVDTGKFFGFLAKCSFFTDANSDTLFYKSVKKDKQLLLKLLRTKYRVKVAISKLIMK